jgi:hypothetical protein
MPDLFGHKEQVEDCLAEHQLDEHNWSKKLLQQLSPEINKSAFTILVLESATNIEQHVINSDIILQQFSVLQTNQIAEDLTLMQFPFLDQLEVFYKFQDPIVAWMDSSFPQIPNAASFGISSICSCEYMFFVEFLLFMICSLHVFLLSYKQGLHFISQMLLWLHWKVDYT